MNAQEKLTKAKKDIELLTKNVDTFSIKDKLFDLASIKKNIAEDDDISAACLQNKSFQIDRENLFVSIKSKQEDIIDSVLNDKTGESSVTFKGVKDYTAAKVQLTKLVNNELVKENYKQDLFNKIEDSAIHLATLETAKEKCVKDEFRLLFVGKSQTGKTTTIDSLCGGRHIGEIGRGIATSAVPLHIMYGEQDSVSIVWKTDIDLGKLFAKIHIDGFTLKDFNIADENSRQQCSKLIENIRLQNDFNKNHTLDEMRYIVLCAVILRFYNSPELNKYRATHHTLENVPQLTKFPQEFEDRWKKNGIKDFKLEECLFAFINRVECSCPLPTLRRMRCRIVDCPGFFANDYDTEITKQELPKADAIIYILPYHSEMQQDIKKDLETFRNEHSDCVRKLIVANNICQGSEQGTKNKSTIKDLFGDNITIIEYNALLSYLGTIKQSYLEGGLTQYDIRHFIISAQNKAEIMNKDKFYSSISEKIIINDFNDAWNFESRQLSLKKEISCEDIIKYSGILNLTDNIKTFVEHNREYSLIYANGIDRMQKELKGIKRTMITRFVEPYKTDRGKLLALWEERTKRLCEFKTICKNLTQKTLFGGDKDSLYSRLSEQTYNKLFTPSVYDEMINGICKIMFENRKELVKLSKNEDKLKKFITPLVSKKINSIIESKISEWNSLLQTNQDGTFNQLFSPTISNLRKELELEWRKIFWNPLPYEGNKKRDELFIDKVTDYLTINQNTESFGGNGEKQEADMSKVKNSSLPVAILQNIAVIVSATASFVASYICFLILSAEAAGAIVLTNPFTILMAMFGLFAGGIVIATIGPDVIEERFIKNTAPKIKQKFEEGGFYSKMQDMIKDSVKAILQKFANGIVPDENKFNNDKEVALNSPEEAKEKMCFTAIDNIKSINSQVKLYEEFTNSHIIYE